MTGEDIVGLHGVHISQTIWRGEWLAKAIDKEIASRAAAANEALKSYEGLSEFQQQVP